MTRLVMSVRVSYSWTDEYYNDALNSEIIKQDSYGLLAASINYRTPNDKVMVSLFGKNLADEEYFEFGFNNALTTQTWGGMPRTWGVRLSYEY